MRSVCYLALSLGMCGAAVQAAEIRVLSPGVVFNAGLINLASDFTRETGVKVFVLPDLMGRIMDDIRTRTPSPDVVVLPMDLMATLALENGIAADTFTPLGRVEVGLAVRAGTPHPDISTVAKLAAALRSAHEVVYSSPASGMSMEAAIIDQLLKRSEFASVHGVPTFKGEGGQALSRGEGDMALQLVCEILPYPEISLVGPLPPELGAHIDNAVAVSAKAVNSRDASRFIHYITSPQAAAVWKANGLGRY